MAKQVVPPKPDDVALAFAAAMLGSGRFGDDYNAAVMAAWAAVPHFYTGRVWYAGKIAPMFFVPVAPRPSWWARLKAWLAKPPRSPRTAETVQG